MGKHKVWRKTAKKFRRKRIRQLRAKERCKQEEEEQRRLEQSPTYIKQREEIELLEALQEQEEKKQAEIEHQKWLQREQEAQKQWQELQERLERARSQKERQEQIIREEWEREQKLIMEKKRQREEQLEAEMKRAEEIEKQIKNFIEDGGELPASLNVSFETNPDKEICPFFKKTGACRFRDTCSRNHIKPGASRILLLPGFYSHFGIEQSNQNEYDVDISLEYDEDDTYAHFTEFYNDVYPEFKKYGEINCFRVCKNFEAHLRGNVYVEYDSLQSSLKAYRIFQGRWYGGKQIRIEFVNIPSWTSAICGLFYRNKCPKGRSCNFLHVFVNPGEKFQRSRPITSHLGHCRWSESPEMEIHQRSSQESKYSRKRSSRDSTFDSDNNRSDEEVSAREHRHRSGSSRSRKHESSHSDYRYRTESSRSKKYDERTWSDVEDYSRDHYYNGSSRSKKYESSRVSEDDNYRDHHHYSESSRSRKYDRESDEDYSRTHCDSNETLKSRKKHKEHKSKKRKRSKTRDQ